MRLFFSGFGARGIDLDPRIPKGTRYRLLSCHEEYLKIAYEFSEVLRNECEDPFELMLDSGAFTAWSKGKEVDLDDLIRVYDDMMNLNYERAKNIWLISLDKIPGNPGRTAGKDEIDECCRISDENFGTLQKRYGDRVLPVFHQNESTSRLHEVSAMAPYICVSPRNDLHENSRVKWAAEVHAAIPGKNTHGLAATGYQMMTTMAWGSVDSASWIFAATNGAIYLGEKNAMRTLQVSAKSAAIKDANMHVRNIPKILQDAVSANAERRGFTLEGLENDFKERLVWNRVILTEVFQKIPEGVEHVSQASLFDL